MSKALVVLAGLPGSGKTTLARWLARHSSFSVISRDEIRAAMFPQCSYTLDEKRAAYDAMRTAISLNLALGREVCTDGITFSSSADREDMYLLATAMEATLVFVHCDCPPALAQERVAADRDTQFPDRTPATVLDIAERFAPLPDHAFRLDMTQPVDEVGPCLLNHLSTVGCLP